MMININQNYDILLYTNLVYLNQSKKLEEGEIIHGFIGCRCTEWYRG